MEEDVRPIFAPLKKLDISFSAMHNPSIDVFAKCLPSDFSVSPISGSAG
jgi:hypothetical protein